jgi:CelD/BcsL family acetyltransferase involved in cellulose biosynthesis
VAIEVDVAPATNLAALGQAWRGLEAQAGAPSFFQSWSWVGCLAEERFPDPVLLRATARDGRLLGLALANRRRGRLVLGASGDPALDTPYVEHNAPLLAADAGPEVAAAMLRAAWRAGGVRRLVLPGVPAGLAELAGAVAWRRQRVPAPYVDLAAVRAAGGGHLGTLSANARYQLRRSSRSLGTVELARAGDAAEATAWLDELVALHARDWQRRGRPGAFATPFMLRFHRALIARAMPRGEIDLLHGAAGGRTIGYLYNFRWRGRVLAYQSGIDRDAGAPHGKPGLTLHQLAIERALASGEAEYDFLAGDARYKTSLANACRELDWVELVRAHSLPGLLLRIRRALVRGRQ